MKISRRSVLAGALAAGVLPSQAARAQATDAGSQTVKLIGGFPAGGSQDNVGRILADRLSVDWRASAVVENVAGAGNIAMDRVAKGPADGGQILIVPPGRAANQFLYTMLAFDPAADSVPLALVATFLTCYVYTIAQPSAPWPNLSISPKPLGRRPRAHLPRPMSRSD